MDIQITKGMNVDSFRKLHVIFKTYLLLGFSLLNACRCGHHNASKHHEKLTQWHHNPKSWIFSNTAVLTVV